jgi:hypothetical protein
MNNGGQVNTSRHGQLSREWLAEVSDVAHADDLKCSGLERHPQREARQVSGRAHIDCAVMRLGNLGCNVKPKP